MASTYNTARDMTPELSIDEVRKVIANIGHEVTVIVQSEPGCGKTSLLGMLKEDLGEDEYDYIYVDCPAKDMSDIALTIPNHNTKRLEHYVAELFKLGNGKKKVIMLDEFLKTPKLMQIIYTRLILERMVGDEKLPDGSIVYATSNHAADGLGDFIQGHVGNRVCIVKMQKPTADHWMQWASANHINTIIRAWVKMVPRCLASYTSGDQEDNPYIFNPSKPQVSYVSPRSLAKANVIVEKRDILGETATLAALAGTVGFSAAHEMSAYFAMARQIPSPAEVLRDPLGVTMPEDTAAVLMMVLNGLDVIHTQDGLSSYMQFINRIRSEEIQAVFFTMALRNQRVAGLARGNASISNWAAKNYIYFGN